VPEPNGDRQKIRELNALPAKDVLKNKSRVCPPISAVCEIMDNIFDNFEENGAQRNLAISFIVKTVGAGEISIAENSGGIRDVKLEPLVRLGLAYHSAKGSIGIWGEGLKVAVFALGSVVEIFTHFPAETPALVSFPEGWLESPDWTVPVYAIDEEAPPPGVDHLSHQKSSPPHRLGGGHAGVGRHLWPQDPGDQRRRSGGAPDL